MPAYKGVTYAPKPKVDPMRNLLLRACPTCGAAVGQPCITKSGKVVTSVTYVHGPRFGDKKTPMATHYAAI